MPLNPPRDGQGNVVPHNDPAITDDGYVVRRINPVAHVTPDENTGRDRISTGAFNKTREPNGGVSVDLGQLLAQDGHPLDFKVEPGFGAVKISVGVIRQLGLWVGADPILPANPGDPDNPYHGQIWNNSKSSPKKLHQNVTDWVVPLPGVAIR